MSIYFVHTILALCGFSFFAALAGRNRPAGVFFGAVLGVGVGILLFKFAKYSLLEQEFRLVFDGLGVLFLLASLGAIFFKFKLKWLIFFLLGICYGVGYGAITSLFPLFSSQLLDTQSIISCFLMAFGFLTLVGLFLSTAKLAQKLNKTAISLAILSLLILLSFKLSGFALELMRLGKIQTHPELLSLIAKAQYLALFSPYIFGVLFALLGLIALLNRPKKPNAQALTILEYRFIKASRAKVNLWLNMGLASYIVLLGFCLYYDLYASKPLAISDPTYIEPKDGKFTIPAQILNDNKLHRYAYITDDGRVVRFFLLNRYKDKQSPVAVFDACAICGDVGYVKKGDELICVACNVRIFLPSVGKEGGCNPIPMRYEFDGTNITIALQALDDGLSQFQTFVKKELKDPVSGEMTDNQSKFTLRYKDKTYYFINAQNRDKFSDNPQDYIRGAK